VDGEEGLAGSDAFGLEVAGAAEGGATMRGAGAWSRSAKYRAPPPAAMRSVAAIGNADANERDRS
jgi:hypothetical protein